MSDQSSGGQMIVDRLRANGVDRVFTVPGESFLPVLDALHDVPEIQLVVCRQEGGATMMAEAHAKLTGRPGVCFVTRGPGSANALAGLHVAAQDSTPLLVFVGQIPSGFQEREAWQEVDVGALFGPVAKWATDVQHAERLPEHLNRAFATAQAGRKGPVVMGLPENLLYENVETAAAPTAVNAAQSHPAARDVEDLERRLAAARRPLAIFGGSGWSAEARDTLTHFVEARGIPVITGFRRQDRFDNTHPLYAGDAGLGMNPALAELIQGADLILAVGTRLGDITTRHYQLLSVPRPRQQVIHVHPQPEELGHVYQTDLAICAGVEAFAAALSPHTDRLPDDEQRAWMERASQVHRGWVRPTESPGPVQLARIVRWLGQRLPPEAVISNGAGNYTLWVHRFYPFRALGSALAPTSGSMGYGLPAAIAAKLDNPQRPAVCFAGDGCFLMTCQELATAVQYGANVIVIVVNNGSYGSIRMHQERQYPGRRYGTDLVNPDLISLARAFGTEAERVTKTEDFEAVFERALSAQRPFLIELPLDPGILKP
ncbi:thiamine pyrophosphate protein [Alcanivorax balearicus MACL04]|uniref:Thiamine pyrophosphate protein n=1 Tax=Alloalcanivorax balearicus MACL04 TaxID=1177182 RepID=A0ABT2R4P0_9GAMM|nr:thiamine pyrophosphate-binding protein [Alloalcanivorax balearicus]MCU5784724.1 thiamine pyrophosphate protein [Alloalcanivorax balearicus MACL04]